MKRLSPLLEAIGLPEVLALCGMLVLTVSLSFYDWRLAGAVTGGLLVMVAISPYLARLFRGPQR